MCFAVWAGGVFFLLFRRGTGVHSLTGLPGLSSSNPTTKKTKQQKKNGFLQYVLQKVGQQLHNCGSNPDRMAANERPGQNKDQKHNVAANRPKEVPTAC